MASSQKGFQALLDHTDVLLSKCGLIVNYAKSFSSSIRNVPHAQKSIIDKSIKFRCGNRDLPALSRVEVWSYLEVSFTPKGAIMRDLNKKLQHIIEKLSSASLKPQQRLFGLKTVGIPTLFHQLTLGPHLGDTIIRKAVRSWLRLPTDNNQRLLLPETQTGVYPFRL